MAARGAGAAAGDAGDRVSRRRDRLTRSRTVCAAFRQGLKDIGYVEGENVAIDYRWAEGQVDRLPALAADLVRRQVAVIATTGDDCRRWRPRRQPRRSPSSSSSATDPVRLGLVASLARPGGNVTGINFFTSELAAKRLELLRELVPERLAIAVLVNPANTDVREATLRDVEAAARAMGLHIQVLQRRHRQEIDAAFATFARERPDALVRRHRPILLPAGASN